MLFPREEDYFKWFEKAGFTDVKLKRVGPSWYRGVRRHGLVIGCVVTGTKTGHGASTVQLASKVEEDSMGIIEFVLRFIIGYIASAYFMIVPAYMWLKNKIVPFGEPI
ncbi:hypothetical protein GIB67_026982 [Kingdonia uniflora]|uniref:MPBQ/MBSQ family SAM-binding methyltransferase profile domain-containing protein n=1 Tax=Kingdonia uniflora TaxID=39325 RepID=A0A7J7P1E1_9MAGN|nr:hypothetical protein GIB67_026982 [Kingdonia uniflora]